MAGPLLISFCSPADLAAAAVVHSAMDVAMQETAGAVVTSLVTVVTDQVLSVRVRVMKRVTMVSGVWRREGGI